jgi:hypothetical protein
MEEFKIDPTIQWDVVELPSRGIYYENKKKSVRVAYLTAVDENILSSPNLIATNGVINELLRNKILDKDLNIEDIVEEDKQAILIFLRNTAFGSDYNVTVIDPKTNKEFKVQFDLSTITMSDFKLKETSNGEYEYFLEKSKIPITFKFLNQKQLNELENIKISWNGNGVPPIKSKELEFMIKSINGNRDIMEIYSFIQKMPIVDSQEFRKFVNKNKPKLDLVKQVETPSGDVVNVDLTLGFEFFRPFYGL